MQTQASITKKGFIHRFLDGVQAIGNECSDPILLFIWLYALTMIASKLLVLAGVSVVLVILGYMQVYRKGAGIGTLAVNALPYSRALSGSSGRAGPAKSSTTSGTTPERTG